MASIIESLADLSKSCGFEYQGVTSARNLVTRPEVRDMCAADKCKEYDHSWACPPGCGTIEHYQELIDGYETCFVVQSVGQLEDPFDIDTIMETAEKHKRRFEQFAEQVREIAPDALFLSAGSCKICDSCTYPDAPCRFPDKRFVSMEAAGLVVNDVCTSANVDYNHGQNTMAYSSCVLI